MKNKPLLLIDIDGVLSPLGVVEQGSSLVHNNGWTTFQVPFFIIEFLNAMKDDVEYVCSSSWEKDSESLFRSLFIEVETYVDFSVANGSWQKTLGLKDFINNNLGRQIIVLDDEFTNEFLDISDEFDNVTVFEVNGINGLTEDDLKMLKIIINTLS